MKLRNKKTGEIGDIAQTSNNAIIVYYPIVDGVAINPQHRAIYESLAELNREWEDYEEPKVYYYYIDNAGSVMTTTDCGFRIDERREELGNYFKTKVEAEKAVEKLKAWKRLKDDGLKIRKYELNGGTDRNGCFTGDICLTLDISKPVYEDILQLLFGGEE